MHSLFHRLRRFVPILVEEVGIMFFKIFAGIVFILLLCMGSWYGRDALLDIIERLSQRIGGDLAKIVVFVTVVVVVAFGIATVQAAVRYEAKYKRK